MSNRIHPSSVLRGLCVAVALIAFAGVSSADFSESLSFSGSSLDVNNLIGEIKVVKGSGSGFKVDVKVQGSDASRETVKIKQSGNTLTVVFPNSNNFVYPRLGSNSKSTFSTDSDRSGGWLAQIIDGLTGSDRITVRGSGNGKEVWADITIAVPSGGRLNVRHGCGTAEAQDVDGDISLKVRSGKIDVNGVNGSLNADTGSGHVTAVNLRGNVNIDTGSGHVEVREVDADDFLVDTGSGHVEAENIRAQRSFKIDTGSGHVEARDVRAYNGALIDTGSGSVTLELIEMGKGRYEIDTGSGSVRLTLPVNASARVHADTGSGGIELDLASPAKMTRQSRDEVTFTLGSGDADISIDTGSGRVSIRQ